MASKTRSAIDAIEIEISTNSKEASKGIDALTSSLDKLKKACVGNAELRSVAKGLSILNKEISKMNSTKAKKIVDNLEKANSAIEKTAKSKHTKEVAEGISNVSDALNKVNTETSNGKGVENINTQMSKTVKSTRKATEGMGYFLGSLKRIVMYRGIYAGMKLIEEGLKEGLSNAYQFARIMGGDVAKNLDNVSQHVYRMKNQLGALSAQFLTSIAPVLIRLADLVNAVADHITEMLSAFNGQTTYMKAQLVSKVWEDAKDSLMEYKKQLSGLDELNVISKDEKASQEKYDFKDLYTEAKVSDSLKWLSSMKIALDSLLWDTSRMSADTTGNALCTELGTLLGAGIGFEYGGASGAVIGSIAGLVLTAYISNLLWKEGTGFDLKASGELLAEILTGLCGAYIGFKYTGTEEGAFIGATVGASIGVILGTLAFKNGKGKAYKEKSLFNKLSPILTGFVGGAIAWTYTGGNATGALVGASIGASLGLIISSIAFKEDSNSHIDAQSVVRSLASVLVGVVGGAIMYKATGNVKGAVIGATVGIRITSSLVDYLWNDKLDDKINIINSLGVTLGGAIGAIAGYGLTKNPKGAVIGFTIGVSVTLAIQDITARLFDASLDAGQVIAEALGYDVTPLTEEQRETARGQTLVDKIKAESSSTSSKKSKLDTIFEETKTDFENMMKVWWGSMQMAWGLTGRANGGYVGGGHLFFANENGNPEYIGNMGGTTAVANSDQMAEAIEGASYRGMARALQQYGSQNGGSYEPMSGDDMFVFLRKKATSYTQRTGNPAFN